MATVKVSELTEKTSPSGSEELLINDGGTSKKITVGNLPDTNTTYTSSDFTHDDLTGFVANEHIDWTTDQGATNIHSGNYTDTNTTYTAGTNVSIDGSNVISSTDTNTTYSVQDGELSENNFTDADHSKLDGIEASADVTDTTNVTAAGALMDSEVTNLADVKAFDTSDYATAAQGTTANAALPKAGGALTGAVTTNSTFDGVDIATRDAVLTSTTTTANAALPKSGGTMTGTTAHGDNVKSTWGTAPDLEIYHDGSDSIISDVGDGGVKIFTAGVAYSGFYKIGGEILATFQPDAGVKLYYDQGTHTNPKLQTTANGVTVTGGAVGTMTTDNDGSFSMSDSNNFKCTPTGNFTLTFTNIVSQSGFILLVNSGGHTVSAHANSKVDANLLATVTTAGTYLMSYFSDGTNVYLTNSAIYT